MCDTDLFTGVCLLSDSPCTLCPFECGALRQKGSTGRCGCTSEMRIARAALHYWEEPVISGTSGSGAVFFSGCSLGCVYCQNYTLAANEVGYSVSPEHLSLIFLRLQQEGAHNINLVTPTQFALPLIKTITLAREKGVTIPMVWNTSSYEKEELINCLSDFVDVYLADYKYADPDMAWNLSHVDDYHDVALSAIERMVDTCGTPQYKDDSGTKLLQKGVIVRHLLLPGHVEESMTALHRLFQTLGTDVLYSLMNQYTPLIAARVSSGSHDVDQALSHYPELATSVSFREYERLLDYADSIGIPNYFWQQGGACDESFIPAWDGTGVI